MKHVTTTNRALAITLSLIALVGGIQIVLFFLGYPFKPDTKLVDGEHIVFIFATNGNEDDENLHTVIPEAIDSARVFSKRSKSPFSTVGVNIEWDPQLGYEFLQRFGRFDEISLGRRWLNSSVNAYITATLSDQSLPQVIVVRQRVAADNPPLRVLPPTRLLSIVGRDRIQRWVKDGARIAELRRAQR